jgi:hypothetical protein
MGAVIVEQQANQRSRTVIRIEPPEEGNERMQAMPLGDQVMQEATH